MLEKCWGALEGSMGSMGVGGLEHPQHPRLRHCSQSNQASGQADDAKLLYLQLMQHSTPPCMHRDFDKVNLQLHHLGHSIPFVTILLNYSSS